MPPIRIAIVGVGKIARDQHLPAIAADADFELAAVATRSGAPPGLDVPCFPDIAALIASGVKIDAVSLCTPPVGRHAQARQAIAAGLHVMLEKPPGASVSEVLDLAAAARGAGTTLFATWHSRAAAAVEPARKWLADRAIRSVQVNWKEDVRRWHPGQQWIWEPGGLGVFDPGINALSVITRILPRPLFLQAAELSFPANRAAPIAAELSLSDSAGTHISCDFDWRQTGDQLWEVLVGTESGLLHLSEGGARLAVAGKRVELTESREYAALYRRFAELVRASRSDADVAPFQLVADAFMLGRRVEVESFAE